MTIRTLRTATLPSLMMAGLIAATTLPAAAAANASTLADVLAIPKEHRVMDEQGRTLMVISRVRGSAPVAAAFGLESVTSNRFFETVWMTDEQIRNIGPFILRHDDVTSLEADIRMIEEQSAPNDPGYNSQTAWLDWGPESLGASSIAAAFALSEPNKQLNIAVIDSNFGAHPDLIYGEGIRLASGVDTLEGQQNFLTHDTVCSGNSTNHGTTVMSVMAAQHNNSIGVAGILPDAHYMAINTSSSCSSPGGATTIANAILWAAGEKDIGEFDSAQTAHIINMSFAGNFSLPNCPTGLQEAINFAVNEKGILLIAGAGNNPNRDPGTVIMGLCENITIAGGVTASGQPWASTSRGDRVDYSAISQWVPTVSNIGTGFTNRSGTSYAAPTVAGIFGLLWQHIPELDRADLLAIAERSTTPLPGNPTGMGRGVLNAMLMFENALTLLDEAVFQAQHPERLGGVERGLAAFIDSKAPGANTCGLVEVDASASLRESQQYAVLFRVPNGQPLRNDNGTVIAAQRQDRFLVPGASLQVAGQYGLQICDDAQGQSCLIGPLVPVDPALAGQGFGC